MRERHNRLAVVKELIKNNRIDNQDTLLEMLKTEGYTVTQATLSHGQLLVAGARIRGRCLRRATDPGSRPCRGAGEALP